MEYSLSIGNNIGQAIKYISYKYIEYNLIDLCSIILRTSSLDKIYTQHELHSEFNPYVTAKELGYISKYTDKCVLSCGFGRVL